MSVTNLADERAKRSPHATGPAVCMRCGHEWQFVAPWPLPTSLECPSCGDESGRQRGLFGPDEDEAVFECACGNDRLIVLATGQTLCELCGTRHDGMFPS